MNTNQKKLKLVMEGIKASTLNKMTDSQVDILFSKLQEQVTTTTKQVKTVTVPQNIAKTTGADIGNVNVKTDANGNVVATEMQESEIDEKFESKKQQKYFFAKCGDGKTKEQKKWCKMADEFGKKTNFAKLPEKKKETKEGYDDMIKSAYTKVMKSKLDQMTPQPTFGESEIEKEILRIVERHITPKMSKQELLSLFEGDTKTAPAKPKVNPGTKPKHPFQPDPNKKGAPKAKKREMGEDTKTAPAKPKVNPGTKPKHPFQPDPNKKGAPKAMKKELPSFLTFNALGLNK
tara:strand:+ start:1099 stop:1968 length:870 start_codon:yes stop_codon:yes gene_type:complete